MPDKKTLDFMGAIKFEWGDIDFTATDQALRIPAPKIEKQLEGGSQLVPLVPIEKIQTNDVSITQAILNRRSHRRFSDTPMSLDELSYLLFCTQGIRQKHEKYTLRTVPSAGARHALETYVFVDRATGLAPGIYRYIASQHALVQEQVMSDQLRRDFDDATNGQLFGAAAYFVWTAIPYRMAWRYAFATPKLLALDVGHVCENLYLACEAVGCGTCAIGAYSQKKIDALLGIDGVEEFAIYMAPVGKL